MNSGGRMLNPIKLQRTNEKTDAFWPRMAGNNAPSISSSDGREIRRSSGHGPTKTRTRRNTKREEEIHQEEMQSANPNQANLKPT
jgi:hypothetical protein